MHPSPLVDFRPMTFLLENSSLLRGPGEQPGGILGGVQEGDGAKQDPEFSVPAPGGSCVAAGEPFRGRDLGHEDDGDR